MHGYIINYSDFCDLSQQCHEELRALIRGEATV